MSQIHWVEKSILIAAIIPGEKNPQTKRGEHITVCFSQVSL